MATETKTAKVVSATYKKSLAASGKYKEGFIHIIEFENKDCGEYLSRSFNQDAFIVGKEVQYTIQTETNGNFTNVKIRPVTDRSEGFTGGGGGGFKKGGGGSNESFAASYAKDVFVAKIGAKDKEFTSKEFFLLADAIYSWLENKKNGVQTK